MNWLSDVIPKLIIGLILIGCIIGIFLSMQTFTEAIINANKNPPPEPPSAYELGFMDGKNETYNPRPGKWLPEYQEGFRTGVLSNCKYVCQVTK